MSSRSRMPPDINGMTSLKVDNLTYRTTPDDLRYAFGKYGDVGDVYIPRDRMTNESRGFAFVRFYDRRDANDAMDAMDGAIMDGRELRVQMARYGRPNDSHRNSGRQVDRRYYGERRYRSRSRGRRRHRSHSNSRSYSRSKSPRGRSRSPGAPRHSKSSSRGRSHSPAESN